MKGKMTKGVNLNFTFSSKVIKPIALEAVRWPRSFIIKYPWLVISRVIIQHQTYAWIGYSYDTACYMYV